MTLQVGDEVAVAEVPVGATYYYKTYGRSSQEYTRMTWKDVPADLYSNKFRPYAPGRLSIGGQDIQSLYFPIKDQTSTWYVEGQSSNIKVYLITIPFTHEEIIENLKIKTKKVSATLRKQPTRGVVISMIPVLQYALERLDD